MADAIALIEDLSGELRSHVSRQEGINSRQEGVNAEQAQTNREVQKQIFDTRLEVADSRKETALVGRGVEEIKEMLRNQKMSWQFWVGIGIAAIPGVWGIIQSVLGK